MIERDVTVWSRYSAAGCTEFTENNVREKNCILYQKFTFLRFRESHVWLLDNDSHTIWVQAFLGNICCLLIMLAGIDLATSCTMSGEGVRIDVVSKIRVLKMVYATLRCHTCGEEDVAAIRCPRPGRTTRGKKQKTASLPKMTTRSAERKGGGQGGKTPWFETIISRNLIKTGITTSWLFGICTLRIKLKSHSSLGIVSREPSAT